MAPLSPGGGDFAFCHLLRYGGRVVAVSTASLVDPTVESPIGLGGGR